MLGKMGVESGQLKIPDKRTEKKSYPLGISLLLFYLTFLFFVSYWVLGLIVVFLLSSVGCFFASDERNHQVAGIFIHKFFRYYFLVSQWSGFVKIDATGLRGVDPASQEIIVVANHPSLWDAALLFAQFPGMTCIMKHSLFENLFLKKAAQWASFIPNAPSLLFAREAGKRLEKKGSILMFPEGTRSKSDELHPFSQGVGLLATRHQTPIQPVFIYSDSHFLEKGWPLWKAPDLPIKITLITGELQSANEGETAKQFTQRLQRYFKEQLPRQRP